MPSLANLCVPCADTRWPSLMYHIVVKVGNESKPNSTTRASWGSLSLLCLPLFFSLLPQQGHLLWKQGGGGGLYASIDRPDSLQPFASGNASQGEWRVEVLHGEREVYNMPLKCRRHYNDDPSKGYSLIVIQYLCKWPELTYTHIHTHTL